MYLFVFKKIAIILVKMFEYDHSLLSISALHSIGIRSPRELEEVIEGKSFADELFIDTLGYSVIRCVGFNAKSRAIKVAFKIGEKGRIVFLDARIPSVEEIIRDFCRHC